MEDEIYISYENLDEQYSGQENNSSDSVDLETGLIRSHPPSSTKSRSRSRSKNTVLTASTMRQHPHPGTKNSGVESPDPATPSTVSQHIKHSKPRVKLVRLDLDNQVRTITPESGRARRESGSGLASLNSTSTIVSSPKKSFTKKRPTMNRKKSERENCRKDSVSTKDSGITFGSRAIGISGAIETMPTIPSGKSLSITSPMSSPGIASEESNNNRIGSFHNEIRDYTGEAYGTINRINSSRGDSVCQQQGPLLSPKDAVARNNNNKSADSHAGSGFSAKWNHIADLLDTSRRRDTLDTWRSKAYSVGSSEFSWLGTPRKNSIHQPGRPRMDSPTLDADPMNFGLDTLILERI